MTALEAAHVPYLLMMVRDKYYPTSTFAEVRERFEPQFQQLVLIPAGTTTLVDEMTAWKQTKSLEELSALQFAYADSLIT